MMQTIQDSERRASGYRHCRNLAMIAPIVLFTGCATTYPLMPTPTLYVAGQQTKPLFTHVPDERKKTSVDLLYVTDREPGTEEAKTLPYSAERSRSMAFGTVTIEFGENVAWDTLVAQSTVNKRSVPVDLRLGPATELGRFPPIAYEIAPTAAGIARAPAVVDAHAKAAAMLRPSSGTASQRRRQGSRAIRPWLRQHLPGRIVHDGRTMPFPWSRVCLRGLHVARGRIARPVLRLQRR